MRTQNIQRIQQQVYELQITVSYKQHISNSYLLSDDGKEIQSFALGWRDI